MITDLESTIKHLEEVAEAEERSAKLHQRPDKDVKGSGKRYLSCLECAKEHRQLAAWLSELVHLRNITKYLRDMVTCFEFMDSMHYNEDIIEWAESEWRVDTREVDSDECNL